jgi:regulator of protease activity HflC (stomatin/prohibitin superfamily)
LLATLLGIAFAFIVIGVGAFFVWSGSPKTRSEYDRRYNGKEDVPADKSSVMGGIGAILGGILLFILALGFAEVPAGHVGIVTSFGKVHEQTLNPGLHWNPPFVNAVSLMDSRVQVYTFENIEGASSDLQAVALSGNIQFHLDSASASYIYQTVGVDYKDKVFTRPADTILKSVTPRYRAQDIVGQRVEIGALTATELQAQVAKYGITVDMVNISNIGLSPEFLQSIEDKVRAEQEAAKERTLIEVSKAQAQQQIERANGEAEAVRIAAQGQADANNTLNLSLTPTLIEWQRILKLNPNVQVIYLPSDGEFILPLPGTSPAPTTP